MPRVPNSIAAAVPMVIKSCAAFVSVLLLVACAQPTKVETPISTFVGPVPVNMDGWWERDYSRGDETRVALQKAYGQLTRYSSDPRYANGPYNSPEPTISSQDAAAVLALARLADLITRLDVLTIIQDEHKIVVERKDDSSIYCEFHDGVATGTETVYGKEVCGWQGSDFISQLALPDNLQVTHRFTMSPKGEDLRVVTTVASGTSRIPFTLNRFYRKIQAPASEYNCIETLSMKRVCGTGKIVP